VIAVLRYAFLKTSRDGSLVAFLVFPVLAAIGPWLGVTLGSRFGESGPGPKEMAEMSAMMGGTVAISLASMFAFWTFRGEIASRSIGAFLFASRPLTIVIALIIFGTVGGFAAMLVVDGSLAVLAGASPSTHLLSFVLNVLAFSLTAAAIGVLSVTISAQPTMLIGALWGTYVLFLIPPILRDKRNEGYIPSIPEYLVLFAVAFVCAGVATILLERRCAT